MELDISWTFEAKRSKEDWAESWKRNVEMGSQGFKVENKEIEDEKWA